MSRYAKTIVAVLTWLAVFIQALVTEPVFEEVIADSNITTAEAWKLAIAALGVLGVYAVPNRPPAGQPSDPNISETAPKP